MAKSVQRLFAALSCVVMASLISSVTYAGVMNGTFEAGSGNVFDKWTTLSVFDTPTAMTDADGQFVVLGDAGPVGGSAQIEQQFLVRLPSLPGDALTLSFDFQFLTASRFSDPSEIPDSFQATLYDAITFDSLLPSGIPPATLPAFFAIDDRGAISQNANVQPLSNAGPGLRSGWQRLTVDISSLAGQDVLLDFTLLGGTDTNVSSSVFIDNVVIASASGVVPEPASACIWTLLLSSGLAFRRRS